MKIMHVDMFRFQRKSLQLMWICTGKYQEATGKKRRAQDMIKICTSEYEAAKQDTVTMIEEARRCLTTLNEIALKPNPLSTVDFINLMIEEEMLAKDIGWSKRIIELDAVREKAKLMQSVTKAESDS